MKKGFTLIEIIVAVAAIALMILAISGLTGISIRMNKEALKKDESFNLARSICELYKSDDCIYSGTEAELNIYKYVNSLSDVLSINSIVENKDGNFNEGNYGEIIAEGREFDYTLILKFKRIEGVEEMEGLWVEVIRNDNRLIKQRMNIAK